MRRMREFAGTDRYIYFALAVLAGVGLGLLYGWVISPVKFFDTTPDTLRIDYQTDYVLMVSEAYADEDDIQLALRRLGFLGTDKPVEMAQNAIVYAVSASYAPEDLALMRELGEAVRSWNSALEPAAP